jgi:D-3-phosphoglycerate dehydrogenase
VDLDGAFSRCDFLTIHTPLTNETRGIVGADAFARMKPGVLIVNAARGGIVDETALIAALESGKVGGAALDVFTAEPPPAESPLVGHPRVICTPHLGASTEEAQEKVAVEVAEQVVAYAERNEVRNAVNVAPVTGEVRERLAPWLDLARRLGTLVGQLAKAEARRDFIDSLTVEVVGEVTDIDMGATACTSAVLVGLLQNFMDLPVNDVNAPIIAGDRGLEVSEVKRHRDRDLTSAISVTARSGDQTHVVRGTLFHIGERVEARIVQIDDFFVEAIPQGRVLVVLNDDRPGVIGAVGSILGTRGINVNSLHVGVGGEGVAIALWNVDAEIESVALDEIRNHALIRSAHVVEFQAAGI